MKSRLALWTARRDFAGRSPLPLKLAIVAHGNAADLAPCPSTAAWPIFGVVVNVRILYNAADQRGAAAPTGTTAGYSSSYGYQRRKQQTGPQAGPRRRQAPRNLRDPRDRRDAPHGRPLCRLLGRYGRPHRPARRSVRRSKAKSGREPSGTVPFLRSLRRKRGLSPSPQTVRGIAPKRKIGSQETRISSDNSGLSLPRGPFCSWPRARQGRKMPDEKPAKSPGETAP